MSFFANPNDEKSEMRAKMKDIKNDLNGTKKSIDDIKDILIQVINK